MEKQKLSGLKGGFLRAYDLYSNAIFRHCYFRVYSREDALDLTQETFTKCWKYIMEGGKIKNIRALLYKIALNLVIDFKKKKRASSLDELLESGFEPIANETDAQILTELKILFEKTEKLGEEYRDVFLLRRAEGFSPKEIAKLLDVSPNVVSVRLNRAEKKIKELYGIK